jgi:LysM repeat protein
MLLELLALKEINKPPEIPQPKPTTTIKVEKKKETKPKKIYYTIKKGDTLTKVSKRFKVPVSRVLCANKQLDNPDLIHPSERLKIPHKKDKLKCAKIKTLLPISRAKPPLSTGGFSVAPAGWYPVGQCTWLVWTKRPVGMWGNASDWLYNAQRDGVATGSTPRAGAIGWTSGHVVYVESVHGDTVTISEANYDYAGSIRTIDMPASKYLYIY